MVVDAVVLLTVTSLVLLPILTRPGPLHDQW